MRAFQIRLTGFVIVATAAFGLGCAGGGAGTTIDLRGRTAAAPATGPAAPAPTAATPTPTAAPLAAVSHPDPLPTAAVDPTLFPVNSAARYQPRGQTLFVATTGDDHDAGTQAAPLRTIRHALDLASAAPGTGVVVRGGVYLEGDLQDTQALTIGADGTVVAAAPGEHAIVRPLAANVRDGLAIGASRATWSGISLEGFPENAIAVGVRTVEVKDVVIADVSISMPQGGDGIAIYPRSSTRAVVDGLLLERVSIAGADQGFTVSSGPVANVALRDVAIENRVSAAAAAAGGADAIGVASGDNILVNGVDIAHAENNGIDLRATRAAVVNAHVHGVGACGVQLYSGGDVVDSLIYDCAKDSSIVFVNGAAAGAPAVRYRLVSTTVAFHNRRAGGGGAYVLAVGYDHPQEAIELEIVSCVFYRNTGGIVLSQGTHATVAGSLFFGAANGAVADYAWDGTNNLSIDDSQSVTELAKLGSANGNLGFKTDPAFADPQAASLAGFAPSAASPLVGAGVATPGPVPAIDLVGKPRAAAAPAVGALEPN